MSPVPHPENVPGDFYVEDGCCLRCEVPFTVAPDLFGVDKADTQCIIKRQPTTPDEMDRMYQAFDVSELHCIRYRGRNQVILMRLEDAVCDAKSAPAVEQEARPSARRGWWGRLMRGLGR